MCEQRGGVIYGTHLEAAAELVHDEASKSLALDILRDHDEGLRHLGTVIKKAEDLESIRRHTR